ncbi:hypothetical protein, partial [Vibrio coralliilyticus]|uniref:hypothetical protein n=1 Tax=Vibrio coralliilyticus TaxID=190893 RepID=UPI001C128DA2
QKSPRDYRGKSKGNLLNLFIKLPFFFPPFSAYYVRYVKCYVPNRERLFERSLLLSSISQIQHNWIYHKIPNNQLV